MKVLILDIDEIFHEFDNALDANIFIQNIYKENDDIWPTVDAIVGNTIFIICERVSGFNV